jgi:hypothetical protein
VRAGRRRDRLDLREVGVRTAPAPRRTCPPVPTAPTRWCAPKSSPSPQLTPEEGTAVHGGNTEPTTRNVNGRARRRPQGAAGGRCGLAVPYVCPRALKYISQKTIYAVQCHKRNIIRISLRICRLRAWGFKSPSRTTRSEAWTSRSDTISISLRFALPLRLAPAVSGPRRLSVSYLCPSDHGMSPPSASAIRWRAVTSWPSTHFA